MTTMVYFEAAGAQYCLPVQATRSVRTADGMIALPDPAADVTGIIPGDPPLTVISPLQSTGTHILVIEAGGKTFGLLVDAVTGLQRIDEGDIRPAPQGQDRRLISGTVDTDGQLGPGGRPDRTGRAAMTTGTVLIADDSLVIRAVVRSGLEDEGYRVIEAIDGLDALDQCRQEPPDVILLDIEMPGLDGYQVLSELKSDAGLKNIPVVFLTSRSGMDDVVAGLRGGAHDYLRKPFEAAELLARVGAAIHIKKLQDQLEQRNADLDRISRTDRAHGPVQPQASR